jgi:hypothetical protein
MDPDCNWKGHIGRDGYWTDDVQGETVPREVETDVIAAIADAKGKEGCCVLGAVPCRIQPLRDAEAQVVWLIAVTCIGFVTNLSIGNPKEEILVVSWL